MYTSYYIASVLLHLQSTSQYILHIPHTPYSLSCYTLQALTALPCLVKRLVRPVRLDQIRLDQIRLDQIRLDQIRLDRGFFNISKNLILSRPVTLSLNKMIGLHLVITRTSHYLSTTLCLYSYMIIRYIKKQALSFIHLGFSLVLL